MAAADKKVVMTLCVQAPFELFHAAGIQPYKLACGSHVSGSMAPLHLPALTCPMITSMTGVLAMEEVPNEIVIPTTCDWVVKFSELTGLHATHQIHFMELPHLRENERSARRWLAEIKVFKSWLEEITGTRITRKRLLASIHCYAKAHEVFVRLRDLRRQQKVPAIHFALIMNAMPYMDIETWTRQIVVYLTDHLRTSHEAQTSLPVFFTGSPVVFPNYKMLNLIENAGMTVVADDFCTMERTFPGAAVYKDTSEYGLLSALAQRYHKACICPTFADNHRRINNITGIMNPPGGSGMGGIIFHVLKGCHPYDMESGILEDPLKQSGFRFLRIETDYVKEDEQNIVTRLEAFRRTLRSQEK